MLSALLASGALAALPKHPVVQNPGVAVICYHDLQLKPHNDMTNTPANFEAELKWLKGRGYATLSLDELVAAMEGKRPAPPKSVVLTFDDGYQGVYRYAYPLLKQYGMKGVLFLVTAKVGDMSGDMPHLTWQQIAEMDRAGVVEAQVHAGRLHIHMAERDREERAHGLEPKDLEQDLTAARRDIETHVHKHVRYLAWPYGDYNQDLVKIAEHLGFEAMVTTLYGTNHPHESVLKIKRLRMSTANDNLKRFEKKLAQYGLR